MEGPARMAFKPGLNLWMLVRGIVVDDGLVCGHVTLDGVEEADELLVPLPLPASADHGAIQPVQRREQGGGARPDIVVGRQTKGFAGHGVAAPFRIGSAACVRSSAWGWLFSSTDKTTA